ncbi:MAG: biopolymer transporter ExbD [Acidobacteria bacterium]|nr:biopolymer transporter ExbD [Acidobacteriota bacterium]
MFAEARNTVRRARVDMSPLIDIVFLLLIFFAVTTTFLEQSGMDLELPESSTAGATETASILVEVGANREIRFEGEGVTLQQLEERVGALSSEDSARVTVRADRTMEYGFVIEVVDALRRAGAGGVSLPMVPRQQ